MPDYPDTPPPILPNESNNGNWYTDVYNRASQQGIPASNVVDPALINKVLINQGWTPQAAAWVSASVPAYMPYTGIGPSPVRSPESMQSEAYYSRGNPGFTVYQPNIADYSSGRGAALQSHDIEHESMHAWENTGNPGGTLGIPQSIRGSDYSQLENPLAQQIQLFLASHGMGANWRNDPSNLSYPPQTDPEHYNQQLFNFGWNPATVPDWYRQKYLREYGG